MKTGFMFILLVVIVLAAMGSLTGCARFNTIIYDHAEHYSSGDAEFTDKIENIEVDWVSGSVSVVSHPGNTVVLSEKAEGSIPEDLHVHWWLEGTTLHVRFAESGASLRIIDAWRKNLTLAVPEDFALEDITIRTASAGIDAGGLTAETLRVTTTSGDMNIDCAAEDIELNGVSGSIQLNQRDNADEIRIATTSGDIHANLSHAETVDIASVSGRITVKGASADAISAKTTSGDVSCALEATPSECDFHSVSGAIALRLPQNAEFTARVHSTSGDFESDFALEKDGRTYTCGNGGADMEISTTSGDISIRKN